MSKKSTACDFKFHKIMSGSTQYRVPILDFAKRPFNGQRFDQSVLRRAEMWRMTEPVEDLSNKGKN